MLMIQRAKRDIVQSTFARREADVSRIGGVVGIKRVEVSA